MPSKTARAAGEQWSPLFVTLPSCPGLLRVSKSLLKPLDLPPLQMPAGSQTGFSSRNSWPNGAAGLRIWYENSLQSNAAHSCHANMALLMTPPSITAMHWVAPSLLLRRGLKTRNSLLCGERCCNYRARPGPVCALSLGDDNGIFLKCENAFASYASTVIVCVVAAFVNGVTLSLCGLWCSFMIALFYG